MNQNQNSYPPPPQFVVVGNQQARPQNPYAQPGGYQPQPQPQPYQNQGFQPYQNQGFQPNNNPYVPINPSNQICPFCRRQTQSFPKKAPGGVTWIWCFGLFIFTGCCCCIPFCVESCQDTLMICTVCQGVKGRIEANCC